MRILFFTHYFPPEGNAPATRVHAMCRRWIRAGHRVEVVTGVPNVPAGIAYEGYRNRLYQEESVDGIRVRRVWTWLAANQGAVLRTVNYLSYMISATIVGLFAGRDGHGPDVIVATSPQFFCGWAGVIVSRLRGVPFVLEIRDLWPESITTVGAMRRGLLVRALEALERAMYAAADHVVTVGDGYADRLVERGVPRSRISVITNGVDAEVYQPRAVDPEVRRRFGVEPGDFACAYVGTIGMAGALDVMLDAAERLQRVGRSDVKLLAIGDGAERERLAAAAASRGLTNLRFTGRLAKAEIPGVLASVDACLVHLRKEPLFESVLPSKIFEAAAMGRPILLGLRGSARTLIERAGCGLCFEPEDGEGLVASVLQLAGDPALRAALGRAGREYFTRHYDQDVLATKYLTLLRHVVDPASSWIAPEGDTMESEVGSTRGYPGQADGSTAAGPRRIEELAS